MKKRTLCQLLYAVLATALLLTSCKLDPPIYPQHDTEGETVPGQPQHPVVNTNLKVTTVMSGLDNVPQPSRICTTVNGNIYVTSFSRGMVFKITAAGSVTTVLRNLDKPQGIKADKNGNIYVMITGANKIIKITPDGQATNIPLSLPIDGAQDLAIADDGTIYIADTGNQRILKVKSQGEATVFAGKIDVFGLKDGVGSNAHFSSPSNIRLAADGFLWVIDGNGVDRSAKSIRRITKSGQVNTYYLQKTKGLFISDIAVAKRDKQLISSPVENLFLVLSNNTLSHLGTNGVETIISPTTASGFLNGDIKQAQFSNPTGISVSGANIYIADQNNNAIRKITSSKTNKTN
ncbi:DUF839 domain-containing protein [Mucilaginibacter pallidiroseus]|uniref:DUF839 domain-containing protein n=1 Tax=Mucilaginibacter pallidiroseus TaxID=2599295 RepID=A0A563UC30_9SPHI|nr:DUF839 domain-containing protein [Mucilaginibacter pallidiroseus]TWR28843.1 DUF839 domain-containing protein [Mucilaginibacter pallidiroseus]